MTKQPTSDELERIMNTVQWLKDNCAVSADMILPVLGRVTVYRNGRVTAQGVFREVVIIEGENS